MTQSGLSSSRSLSSERPASSERPVVEVAAPPGGLSVSPQSSDGVLVLAVRGDIDMASIPILEEGLRHAEAADVELVVIDLAEVEFMDSSGLHALLKARERIEQSGSGFSLSRTSPQVRRLLELTGTLERFTADGLNKVSGTSQDRGLHA